MATNVQKCGTSRGLRPSKQLLDDAQISLGDEADGSVRDGVIVVAARKRLRGKHSLPDVVGQIPRCYQAKEFAWGRPAGNEVW